MGQLMSGVEEAMGPFEAMATKFRNYDTGIAEAPKPIPFLMKKDRKANEDVKMESPAISHQPSVKSDAAKEEEKKEDGGQEVTTLKSLNMDDVMKKT